VSDSPLPLGEAPLREVLGLHLLLELYDCPSDRLNDPAAVDTAVRGAAEDAGATIVQSAFHHFSPQGVSGALIIAESHITMHTWPEKGYAAVDLFTCGHREVLERAADRLIARFAPQHCERRLLERGLPTPRLIESE
jgi:S-adenosylmethionine decarboxylase proenzyme